MKVDELKGLAIEELNEKLTGLKKNLMELRFQSKTGKLETKNTIKSTRRDVARIMTVINQQKRAPVAVVKSAPVKKKKEVKAPAEKKVAVKKTVKKLPAKTSKK
jgi:large subunit ribosomal protein L29